MLTEAQREIRKQGIGGSDAAAAIGVDEDRTTVELFLDKTGRAEREEPGEPAYWGNVLEEIVAQEFMRRTGLSVRRHAATLYHPQRRFMLAHIDRRITGKKRGLECKTINAFSGSRLDQPLDKHAVQCHHMMAVTGFEMFYAAYLIGGQRFAIFEIERDPEMMEMLEDAEAEFWGYVERDEMPPLDYGHPKANQLLKRLYPGTNGETIILDDETATWHTVLQEQKHKAAEAEKLAVYASNRILDVMRESAIGTLPDGSLYERKKIKRGAYQVAATEYVSLKHKKASK